MKRPRKLEVNQPSLFDETLRHDYGGAVDSGDFGHEFPFVYAGERHEDDMQAKEGVSVSLVERAMALRAVANMYGLHNRGVGMAKAVQIPQPREELQKRYFDVDFVAERAEANGKYTPEQERMLLQPLLKEKELREAGFVEADIDEAALKTIIEIRQAMGVSVKSKMRQKNLKKLKGRSL